LAEIIKNAFFENGVAANKAFYQLELFQSLVHHSQRARDLSRITTTSWLQRSH